MPPPNSRPNVMTRALAAVMRAPLAHALAAEQLQTGLKSPWSDSSRLETMTPDMFLGGFQPVGMDRTRAMQIATVAKARNTIAPQVGRLPLAAWKGNQVVTVGMEILAQPERGVPRSVTLTNTVDQLMFYPRAYWLVTERNAYGFPAWAKLVAHGSIREDRDGNLTHVDSEPVAPADVIKFSSPLGAGLLADGRETLLRAWVLNQVTARAEDNPVPTFELHDTGNDQMTAEEIRELADQWAANRRRSGVAYTPKRIEAKAHGQQQSQLLIEARRSVQLELVRHMNVSAWVADVTVEGSTLKYENRALRNWELLDLNLAPYLSAIADRLSLPDVTPRGWEVRFTTDQLTRPDELTRAQTAEVWQRMGALTIPEIRTAEGWGPLPTESETE